mmetsp:Transcript_19965/g.43457  ORF Transcript_19965/g.43457 Transcript_19965/m.43457 type:complete len:427 (-) Transcript_19965:375-1655(-)
MQVDVKQEGQAAETNEQAPGAGVKEEPAEEPAIEVKEEVGAAGAAPTEQQEVKEEAGAVGVALIEQPEVKQEGQGSTAAEPMAVDEPRAPSAEPVAAEAKTDAPAQLPEPYLMLRGKSTKTHKVRTFSITLHGLLDYDQDDTDEPTFELSVFAELFHEMLCKEFGTTVYHALIRERDAAESRRDRKRSRDDDSEQHGSRKKHLEGGHQASVELEPTEPAQPSQPSAPAGSEEAASDEAAKDVNMDTQAAPAATAAGAPAPDATAAAGEKTPEPEDVGKAADASPAGAEQHKGAKQGEEEKEAKGSDRKAERKNYHTDTQLLAAFRYFDRGGSGYIKAEDMRRLVHTLGLHLSQRAARDLVKAGCDASTSGSSQSHAGSDRLYYKDLAVKEVDSRAVSEEGTARQGSAAPSVQAEEAAADPNNGTGA